MASQYPQILNLDSYDVYFECNPNNPEYFEIKNLPNLLTYGKHYFTISLNGIRTTRDYSENINLELKRSSQVLFEFKDSAGNIIFSDITDYSSISGTAVGYVWVRKDPLRIADEIADGTGYVTIVGELEGVPQQWENKYNVRLTIPIEIRKEFTNTSPILFQNLSNLQANSSFSESMENDSDSSNYKRAYINVSSSNMETYGGQVSFIELSYKENTSKESEFKNLTTYRLTGSMVEVTSSDLSIPSSLNGLNPPSHEYKFPLPLDTRRGNDIEFKLRFLNPDMEVAQNISTGEEIYITSSNMAITGSPLIIEKDDNLLSGSLFVGSKTEAGKFATKMSFNSKNSTISFKGDNEGTDGIEFYESGSKSQIIISGSENESTQLVIQHSSNTGYQFSQFKSHRLLLYATGRDQHNYFMLGVPASGSGATPAGFYLTQGNTYVSDPEIFISASGGNVGIGTRTPSATLHVAGNLKVDEGMEVLGAITSSIISSSILYSSGSTIFGDAISDTHTFNGHITASGDISASGDLYVDNIYLEKGNFIQFGSADTYISASGTTEDLKLAADDDIILEPDGYVHNQKAYYHGATSTGNNVAIKIGNFSTDDMIRFYAGGGLINPHMIVADDLVTVGAHGLTDVDFKVGLNHLYVDDGLGKTAIGKAPVSDDKEFTVVGSISASSDLYLQSDSNNTLFIGNNRLDGVRKINLKNEENEFTLGIGDTGGTEDGLYILSGSHGLDEVLTGTETAVFIKTSNKYVGIGTQFPTKELQVAGDISASGDVFVEGTVSASNFYLTSSAASGVTVDMGIHGNDGIAKWAFHRNGTRKHILYLEGRDDAGVPQDSLVFKHGVIGDGDDHINFHTEQDDQTVYFHGDVSASRLYAYGDTSPMVNLKRTDGGGVNAVIGYTNGNGSMYAGIDDDIQNSGANIFGIGYSGDLIDNNGTDHATFVVTGSQVVINNATSASSGYALTVGGDIVTTGDVSASGDLYLPESRIFGDSDYNTYINLTSGSSNSIELWSSNRKNLTVKYSETIINPDNHDVNTHIKGTNAIAVLKVDGGNNNIGINNAFPPSDMALTVEGNISASGDLFVGSNSTSDTVMIVQHPETGSLMEVKATNDSGSLLLSGSLFLKNNSLTPSVSESKLYNSDGNLYWSGDQHVAKYPLYPKKRQYYHHNFSDDLNTSTVYLPWFDASESSIGYSGAGNLFLTDATLLKVFCRGTLWTGDADVTMGLKRYSGGSSTHNAIGTKIVSVENANDYDVLLWDWEGTLDSGTNTITAGDTVSLYLDAASDITNTIYMNCTSVWELDLSTELTASIIL